MSSCCWVPTVFLIKWLIIVGTLFGDGNDQHHFGVNAQRSSTVVPCIIKPQNFTFCTTLPPEFQQGCRMRLRHGAASNHAYCEGRVRTWDKLSGPSVGLTLPINRPPTPDELDAQPPPSQIAADLYSSMDIDELCDALRGQKVGYQECYYDPNGNNNTAGSTSSTSRPRSLTPSSSSSGSTLSRCTRKEYRMLSTTERARYHNALLQLKRGFGSYEYNRIAFLHSNVAQMPGAHDGPTFVCWHREYLKRMEVALRAVDPSVCLPYWDSSLDWRLPNPADSVMFSETLMGSPDPQNNNYVTNGFLTNWTTSDGNPIIRNLGGGQLFPLDARDYIINTNQSYNIFPLSYDPKDTACNGQPSGNVLESRHDNVHVWVGGDMGFLETAPQDPIFFMHHGLIDYVWEQFRLKWQTRQQRETQFPTYAQIDRCKDGNTFYQLNTTMVPFVDPEIPNWVCLSNNYTDFLYNYSLSPTCRRAGDCGSAFLFCDTTNQMYPFAPTCCSKIKPGGDCRRFARNNEQPCYNSICNATSGRCAVRTQPRGGGQTPPSQSVETTTTQQMPIPTLPTSRLCYDYHECCSFWAINGTCDTAKAYMNNWCPGVCYFDGCQPYPTACEPGCADVHPECSRWAPILQNPGKVYREQAVYSTRQLPPSRIPMRECGRNPHFMARNCAKTCNRCLDVTQEICAALTPVDYVEPPIPS